jgi:hypothetical protein
MTRTLVPMLLLAATAPARGELPPYAERLTREEIAAARNAAIDAMPKVDVEARDKCMAAYYRADRRTADEMAAGASRRGPRRGAGGAGRAA